MLTYLDPRNVRATRSSAAPVNRNASGYGSKIPSTWELRIGSRWHRVYVIQWSNAGSAYVVQRGERLFLGAYAPACP